MTKLLFKWLHCCIILFLVLFNVWTVWFNDSSDKIFIQIKLLTYEKTWYFRNKLSSLFWLSVWSIIPTQCSSYFEQSSILDCQTFIIKKLSKYDSKIISSHWKERCHKNMSFRKNQRIYVSVICKFRPYQLSDWN